MAQEFKPEVGTLCSILFFTDIFAARVIEISKNKKTIVVQEDSTELLNGVGSGETDALTFVPGGFCGHTSGTQRWKIEPDPSGTKHTFTFRKNNKWVPKGEPMHSVSKRLLQEHKNYYDFNF